MPSGFNLEDSGKKSGSGEVAYDNKGFEETDQSETRFNGIGDKKQDDTIDANTAVEIPADALPKNNRDEEDENADEEEGEYIDPPYTPWTNQIQSMQNSANGLWNKIKNIVWNVIVVTLLALYFVYLGFAFEYEFGSEPSIRLLWITSTVVVLWVLSEVFKHYGDKIEACAAPCLERLAPYSSTINTVVLCVLYFGLLLYVIIDAIVGSQEIYNLVALSGIVVYVLLLFMFSHSPAHVNWRTVGWGLCLQLIFALLILRTSFGYTAFEWMGDRVSEFLDHTIAGILFVFGDTYYEHYFAFAVLPVVVFFSSIVSMLFYLGWMQAIIQKVAWFMQKVMDTTAAESLNAAANIFIGQTEAPLLIRPLLPDLTWSEMHCVMTGGFATIAGGVLAAFIAMGIPANHLISASVMSAPAALAMAKLFYPETRKSRTKAEDVRHMTNAGEQNIIHAACNGAIMSIPLVAGIAVNLIAFLAILEFVNATLTWFGHRVGLEEPEYQDITLELICSYVLFPFAMIMGVELDDCRKVAKLIGVKTILNEFVAYEQLGQITQNNLWHDEHTDANRTVEFYKDGVWLNGGAAMVNSSEPGPVSGQVRFSNSGDDVFLIEGIMSERSRVIATYALCGFANIGSMGIQIGGLGAMSPRRIPVISKLVVRAMIAGNVACFMTASIAALFYDTSR